MIKAGWVMVGWLLCGSAFAQFQFGGLEWGTSKQQARSKMTASKYKFMGLGKGEDAGDLIFKGTVSRYNASVVLRFTPDDQLQNVTVFAESKKDVCETYRDLLETLSLKYLKPDLVINDRMFDYRNTNTCKTLAEGVSYGHVKLKAIWLDPDLQELQLLSIETLRTGHVRLDYYGPSWVDEFTRRRLLNTDDL